MSHSGDNIIPTDANAFELQRLASLDALVDNSVDHALNVIVRLAADKFDVPIALVSLVGADRQTFKANFGLSASGCERSLSFCTHTIQSDALFVVNDAHLDLRFRNNPMVIGEPFIRFYAGAPLITQTGHHIGTLCIIDRTPRTGFSDRDAQVLRLMAGQAIGHLETLQSRHTNFIANQISDHTTDAFICADRHSLITYWNPAAETLFGWTASAAIGQNLALIIPDRHLAAHYAGVARITGGGTAKLLGSTVEVPVITLGGCEIIVELTLSKLLDNKDGMPGGFAAIIRDISARKLLETERDQLAQSLGEHITAIEVAGEGICIINSDGEFTYMNRAYAELFDHPEVLIGRSWRTLFSADETARINEQVFPSMMAEGVWRGQLTGMRCDGSAIAIESSISLSGGNIVWVAHDVSGRIAAQIDQIKLNERLQAAQQKKAVDQITSSLGHDFNNLIGSISLSAALIAKSGDHGSRDAAKRIILASTNASLLVDKMLLFGGHKEVQESFDLCGVVHEVSELLRASVVAPHRVVIDIPNTPLESIAHRVELMQIILNLGVNARDALSLDRAGRISISVQIHEPGAPTVTPMIGVMPTSPAALIRIADTGSGIAAETLPDIFKLHYSSKDAHGHGLGLSIVADIVGGAGGAIAVETVVGEGTCFDIYWPLDQRKVLRDAPVAGTVGFFQGLGVLIADDDAHIVASLSDIFERGGAEVGPCLSARDALAALQEAPDAWSLLITDFDMPGMTGAELAVAARRIRPDLPLILSTALPQAARAHQGWFDTVLSKPIDAAHLLSAAERAILAHRL